MIRRAAILLVILFLQGAASYEECTEEGALQLEGVNANISGILNICHNSTWRLVCDDEWDLADAMVVCRQLGLEYKVSDTIANGCPARGPNITETFLMNDVMCTGAEETLLECPHTKDVADCIHSEAVVVECDSKCIACKEEGAICVSNYGSFSCKCKNGYIGNGKLCEDIDECAMDIHDCTKNNSECINTPGGYNCSCIPGYAGEFCDDTDECALDIHDCHENAMCINTPGSYTCMCNSGYIGNGTYCEPCVPDNPLPIGFTGNGTYCEDIDEWIQGINSCAANAHYRNTPGGFICECKPGYAGDGTHCRDINECALGVHNCPENATCINTPGSFLCTCSEGYSFDGTQCTDIDECTLTRRSICADNANCINSAGSYSCVCKEGYMGNGFFCSKGTSSPASSSNRQRKQVYNTGECVEGTTRLVRDGSSNWRDGEGFVEICVTGQWRAVCNHGWDMNAAMVVCREHGMLTEATVPVHEWDPTAVHYVMSGIRCSGTENSLSVCQHAAPGVHDCRYHGRARVACNGTAGNITQLPKRGATMHGRGPYHHHHGHTLSDYAIGGFATIENDTIDGIIEFYLEKVGNNTVIMVDVDILGLEASKLYNWSIGCSASDTPDVRCDATTQIYDPFNAIANSCNYEKECYRGSPEKCAVGDYLGRFGPIGGSGTLIAIENTPSIAMRDLVGLSVCISDGEEQLCGIISPVFECEENEIIMTLIANAFMGPIEVCIHNKWHRVVDYNWTKGDATVACRQLQLPSSGAVAVYFNENEVLPSENDGREVTYGGECSGSESYYADCFQNKISRPRMEFDKIVGVLCQ